MREHTWLKCGVIALGAIGFVVILVLMLNFGRGLEGPTWVVQEMSVDGAMTAPIPDAAPFAVFEDGTVAGSSGCNSYNGTYQIDGDSMAIGPLASTLMACTAELLGQETFYFELLAQTDSYEVSGDQLTLMSGDTVLIRYES
jgi:heat shock protein HslJ